MGNQILRLFTMHIVEKKSWRAGLGSQDHALLLSMPIGDTNGILRSPRRIPSLPDYSHVPIVQVLLPSQSPTTGAHTPAPHWNLTSAPPAVGDWRRSQ